MLSNISIVNYKSIESYKFDLSKLNLLTGANSTGKSSVIQALLLLSDNIQENGAQKGLVSRHSPIYAFSEVRNYIQNAKYYTLETEETNTKCTLQFSPLDDSLMRTQVTQNGEVSRDLYDLLSNGLLYLPALRAGNLSTTRINTNPIANPLGVCGEYVIDFYYTHREDLISETFLPHIKIAKNLQNIVNYWLQILTGYTCEVSFSGSEYHLQYIIEGKRLSPLHVGTGVSYILTVLIVCLASIKKGIVIIENPEIHLHPSAQADLLDFFAEITNTGTQLIIESHSDHFFNGIRRLLHLKRLKLKDVKLYHFNKNRNNNSEIIPIELSQEGGIKQYIPEMFEQFDKDLNAILS
jgi:predicted ATPase